MSKNNTTLQQKFSSAKGQIAILIDPEKAQDEEQLRELITKAEFAGVSYFFVGGSTVTRSEFRTTIRLVKKYSSLPVIIFPGSNHQLSDEADGMLYLSLLSGRNAEYLIGQHIESASEVLELSIEVIPTAYILIDGGTRSSVAYVSQTTPIPRDKTTIALKTAIAGYLQGKKITYFDAGSGAQIAVPTTLIEEVKNTINTIIIVGGGVTSLEEIKALKYAGANIIVVGNKVEEEIDFLLDIKSYTASSF